MNCGPKLKVTVGKRDREGLRSVRVTAGGSGTLWGWVGSREALAEWADGFGYFDLPDVLRWGGNGLVGWIDGVAVSASCRGAGLGGELMAEAHDTMRRLGVEAVYLQASPQGWEPKGGGVGRESVKTMPMNVGLGWDALTKWYQRQGYEQLQDTHTDVDGNVMVKTLVTAAETEVWHAGR